MASEGLFKRTAFGLSPINANADILDGISIGSVVKVKVSQPRNYEHLQKFFALIAVVFPHQTQWATSETLREVLLIAAGHGEKYETLVETTITNPTTGEITAKKVKATAWRAKSISFAKLPQQEFNKVYDRCVEIILRTILPLTSKAELEAEVLDILKGRQAA